VALDLARWLPEFPVRQHCLYLNHAAVAPLPARVAEAMRGRITEQETSGSRHWDRWKETELSARALASELVGCRPEDISLVRSTSEGLSLIAQGLPWRKGDAVLVGEEEFAANVAPYLALNRRGVAVRRYPTPSGRIELETVVPLLVPPVKVLALSWVAFHTGWVAPVAELAREAHDRKILVVLDAIQGLGVLPDRFVDLGVDALVADGHKWLLGPEGIGIMVTTPQLRAGLQPVLAGWLNVQRPARQFFLHELGPEEVFDRVVAHARALTQVLLKAGWHVGSPGSAHPIAGIVAARHPFLPADEIARRLRERQIEVTARQGWVRFSPHFYATAGELDALAVILGKL
jgi:cysteine desulfurase/selenocysteine lyase